MATSSLFAASRCTRYCITTSRWQPLVLARAKSTTSAIKAGLQASRGSLDRSSRSSHRGRVTQPEAAESVHARGTSSKQETRWGQKRDDRRSWLDGKKDPEVRNDNWDDTVNLRPHRAKGGWSQDIRNPPSTRDGNKHQRLPQGPGKKTRFENEGVRSYGESAGFFSKGTRSNRDTDRPSTRAFDPYTKSSRDNEGDASHPGPTRRLPPRHPSDQERYVNHGKNEERVGNDDVPVAIPYSSAASQWLYGANTVIGALRGNQRKIYQLIMKKGEKTSEVNLIVRLAKQADIPIKVHDDTRLLDKLSEGRPHNGVVLEASALPARPVAHLMKPDSQRGEIPLVVQKQNAEDAAINGQSTAVQYNATSWRQPFILFLDGILDPGNVGGILRTAHFYGVDAVAVSTRTCAPLSSPFLAKASAGACEAIPILAISKAADFILKSGLAGWHICAAVAPDVRSQELSKQSTTAGLALSSPLAKRPCILMMGSEGEGLRDNLRSKADLEVTIERAAPAMDVGVDSMNVSVATGVLVDAFMRKPNSLAGAGNSSNRVF